ncbi:uncharacterized protein LOC128667999 [Microplitis demolitor]|uniref:uncharacterized protein LOC128667999 n=1 Tax=Microplitis demolitor TaxID=69319 RepID=UPI0004CDB8A5|nr:uncharacterized protein LOC128667999 [Microplitis demolitor]
MHIYYTGFLVFIAPFSEALYTYQSQTPKKYVNYHSNPYVSAFVTGKTSNTLGDIFLKFHQKINRQDNFQISVQITNEQGAVIMDIIHGINLCDQLDIELMNLQPFSHSNVFGLTGLQCPIDSKDVRDMIKVLPFYWPENHYFPIEVGCGVRNYQVTLSKCLGAGFACKTLIQSRVKSNFESESCLKQSFLLIDLIMIKKGPKSLEIKSVNILDRKLTKVSDFAQDNIVGTQVDKMDVIDAETNTIAIVNDNNIELVDTGAEKYHAVNVRVDKIMLDTDTNNAELTTANAKKVETSADDVKLISGSDSDDNNLGLIETETEKHKLLDVSAQDILLENNKDGGLDVIDNRLETIKRDDEINSTADLYQDE